jgi:hypothetical protein
MLDFPQQDVDKFQQVGYEARRGATGLHDRNEFCLPYAIQDVEVLFAQVRKGSFTNTDMKASANSVEDTPFFKDLLREIWLKTGWVVLFIAQNTTPEEFEAVGLEHLGVISHDRNHMPESIRASLLKYFEKNRVRGNNDHVELPPSRIPRFVGHAVHVSDEPEAKTLQRFIKSAQMSIFTCLKFPIFHPIEFHQPHIVAFNEVKEFDWLIQDDSADSNVLALKVEKVIPAGKDNTGTIYRKSGILLIPDFGDNNGNVALALLQEVITQVSPHLFDVPQHPWLEKYQPATVQHLQVERDYIIRDAFSKIEQLNRQIEEEREKHSWFYGLLVSTGDQFASESAQALRFLGFEVEEIDTTLSPGERKREDLWIWDKANNYFALGEAKTTGKGRGAAEEFITKTQTHQTRYARENKQVPPPALLIVNYAIDLDPVQRAARFYQDEVKGRLEDNGITAINSVALFDLCQFALNNQISKEHVRQFVSNGQPIINVVNLDEVITATGDEPFKT